MHIERNSDSDSFKDLVVINFFITDYEFYTENLLEFLLCNTIISSCIRNLSFSKKDIIKEYYKPAANGLCSLDVDSLEASIMNGWSSEISGVRDELFECPPIAKTCFDVFRILSKTQTVRSDIPSSEMNIWAKISQLSIQIVLGEDSIKKITIVSCSDYSKIGSFIDLLDDSVKGIGLDLGIEKNSLCNLCAWHISTQIMLWEKFKLPYSEIMVPGMSWGGKYYGKDDYISPTQNNGDYSISQKDWWDYLCYGLRVCCSKNDIYPERFDSAFDAVINYPPEFIRYVINDGDDILCHVITAYCTNSMAQTRNMTDKFIKLLCRHKENISDLAVIAFFKYFGYHDSVMYHACRKEPMLLYSLFIRFLEIGGMDGDDSFGGKRWVKLLGYFVNILEEHPDHYDIVMKRFPNEALAELCKTTRKDGKFISCAKLRI